MYYIIVNPASKSRRGMEIWKSIESILIEKKILYHVFFSENTNHVIQYVKTLTEPFLHDDNATNLKLIVLGGDGTVNEILQGISRFDKVEIGYIPAGSSNDMARDLQLPKNPATILDTILSDKKHRLVDIGKLSYLNATDSLSGLPSEERIPDRYFAVSSGIGFDAAVCEEILYSSFKHTLNKLGLGKLIYLGIALKQIISAKKVSCNIYIDDKEPIHYHKLLFTVGMMRKYEGGGFKFCPDADDTDGLLHVCAVGNITKPTILLALPTAFWGKHYWFSGIDSYQCSTLGVETSSPLWVHTDGEVHVKSSHITMTCLKEKLHLLV